MAWELQYEERNNPGWWYLGSCEECTFEFSAPPEEIPGVNWMVDRIVESFKKTIKSERVLYTKVYYDPAEWYRSKWLVVITAHGSPVPWAVIIPLALALIAVLIIAWIIHKVSGKWWFGPATIAVAGGVAALGAGILIREIRSK